jgi:hypothetical protein
MNYSDQTVEIFNHMDNGLSCEQARTLVKPNKSVTVDADYKLKANYKKWALTNPKRVKKASNIYDRVLSGKPLVDKSGDKPTNTMILSVAKEILDRQYPKVTINQNLNVNVDLSPIDLESYRN